MKTLDAKAGAVVGGMKVPKLKASRIRRAGHAPSTGPQGQLRGRASFVKNPNRWRWAGEDCQTPDWKARRQSPPAPTAGAICVRKIITGFRNIYPVTIAGFARRSAWICCRWPAETVAPKPRRPRGAEARRAHSSGTAGAYHHPLRRPLAALRHLVIIAALLGAWLG